MNTSAGPAAHKISPSHLGRDAYVYIRQSTQTQVMMNTESLARQYELVERAGQLGWHTAQVVTIDADLGRSGARSDGRPGFKELVADVGLGKVGIVLGIEVSRHRHRAAVDQNPRRQPAVPARHPACKPDPRNVTADGQDVTVATITEAEKILGIPRITLYRWLREGFITGEQIVPAAPWHIRIDQALRDKIQLQAPDGWLPADQAAKALGLSRTTVFQKVRDGQLPAIHVSNGQRRSLGIQVKPGAAGLFDTPKRKDRAVSTGPGGLL